MYGRVGRGDFLVAEAPHLDRDALSERLAEILHMHAGSAIDVRRIFLAEERDLVHLPHLSNAITSTVRMRDVLGMRDDLESFGQDAGIERRTVTGVGAGRERTQALVHDPLGGRPLRTRCRRAL